MNLYKYHGAGNDFLIADNRKGKIQLSANQVASLCDRHYGIGADGLMLLESAPEGYDFGMAYYNSDGSTGMMCGNGGRCIVAFAQQMGIQSYRFMAADGPHDAQILRRDGVERIVKLRMRDVDAIEAYKDLGGVFLDTGTRHFVIGVADIEACDVYKLGQYYRYRQEFAPIGANVNFMQLRGDTLWVRTYEKGVEDETCACGTGITAAAIAHWHAQHAGQPIDGKAVEVKIRALRDDLAVQFVPTACGAREVYLIGPATYVARIIVSVK